MGRSRWAAPAPPPTCHAPQCEHRHTTDRWRSSVQVRVTDQGPGIPRNDRERVFEEFYRRDAGRGRGGTGLGLAIARAIIRAHGGTISVGSAPTGGTAVTFELPITKPDPETSPRATRQDGVAT
jgi:signal transduction histidine kinase